MPAAILAVTLLLGFFTLALDRVKFELSAFQFARSYQYGLETAELDYEVRKAGSLDCIEIRSKGIFAFRSEYCLFKIGT